MADEIVSASLISTTPRLPLSDEDKEEVLPWPCWLVSL